MPIQPSRYHLIYGCPSSGNKKVPHRFWKVTGDRSLYVCAVWYNRRWPHGAIEYLKYGKCNWETEPLAYLILITVSSDLNWHMW